jgi:hypothetical protein
MQQTMRDSHFEESRSGIVNVVGISYDIFVELLRWTYLATVKLPSMTLERNSACLGLDEEETATTVSSSSTTSNWIGNQSMDQTSDEERKSDTKRSVVNIDEKDFGDLPVGGHIVRGQWSRFVLSLYFAAHR